MSWKSNLRESFNGLAKRVGFRVDRILPGKDPDERRVAAMRHQQINLVLDVGANNGLYAHSLRRDGYAGRIVSFEPLSAPFRLLSALADSDPLLEAHQIALGNSNGSAEINISANSVSSSILPLAEQFTEDSSRYVGKESIQVRTLDSMADDLIKAGEIVMLKLDVQGFEQRVLEGAVNTLPKVSMIDIELSLVPVYDDSKLWKPMLEFLDHAGFEPISLDPCYFDVAKGRVLMMDALLIRKN